MYEADRNGFKQLTEAHREEAEECRWCFAIDMHQIKADIIAKYDFPDAMVLHLKCPRCGGEFGY